MRLFLLTILATGATLVQAPTVLAQSDYSVTLFIVQSPSPGVSPDDATKTFGGMWTTAGGDTVDTLTFYYSTDGGKTYTSVPVPAANITGAGGVMGGYSLSVPLKTGNYKAYTELISKKGDKSDSTKINFSVP